MICRISGCSKNIFLEVVDKMGGVSYYKKVPNEQGAAKQSSRATEP
jgi:hypothetical protein